MDTKELARICEAILFAAGEPVETERLSFAAEVDPEEVRAVMKELMDLYAFERRGIRILRLEDSWQMCSQNDLAPWVTRALETRKPPKLSASQLETLTIIAYYQPTTRAFVEKLRGVDSAWSVTALLNKKLIEEDGRLDAPGRPILYRTTPDFLRTFALESLDDLPEMEKVQFGADPVGAELEESRKYDHIGPSGADEASGIRHQASGDGGRGSFDSGSASAQDDTTVGADITSPARRGGGPASRPVEGCRPPEAEASDSAAGAGVPDGPQSPPEAEASDSAVGAGALDGPQSPPEAEASDSAAGAGVPDGPQSPPEAELPEQPEGGTTEA